MTGEEAKLEERPLGVGVFAVVLPPPIPPLDLTQGWSQSLCFHFPRGRPQLGGSVAVPLARTLSGQRNQEKGPEELEHGRRIPDRRELEAGPPSFHTRRWLLARPLVWAQGADPEKCGQGLENRTKTEATSHVPDRPSGSAGRQARAAEQKPGHRTSAGTCCSQVTARSPRLTAPLPAKQI